MKLDGKQIHKVKIGGKLNFASLPKDTKKAILERLASKDPTMKDSFHKGSLPGIKIDGKEVTKDNIHEFEVSPSKNKERKLEEIASPSKPIYEKHTQKDLESMSFKQLKVVGNKLGTTDRSRKKLIKEILNLQGGN